MGTHAAAKIADSAKPVALALLTRAGLSLQGAVEVAALWAIYEDQNLPLLVERVRAGDDAEEALGEYIASFVVFAQDAVRKGAVGRWGVA